MNETELIKRWVHSLEKVNEHWDLYFQGPQTAINSKSSNYKLHVIRNKFLLWLENLTN